jgi:hypothetical protein
MSGGSKEALEKQDTATLAGVRLSRENNSDVEQQQARLTVASHAIDAEDCKDLLEMLGLCGPKFRSHYRTCYGVRGRVVIEDEEKAS